MDLKRLLENCLALARAADLAVMEIYNSGNFGVEIKDDNTPLTRADKLANKIISEGLQKFSDLPIMSEEGGHDVVGNTFWCVDPIDGTKEFIARNGEFTVNIGLIENSQPVLGVVSIPAQGTIYYGAKGLGAFKQTAEQLTFRIESRFSGSKPVVAVSRSHNNLATDDFLARLNEHETVQTGSSIKFLLVAEGSATIFPCLSERHLWDTAATDAILRAAGGSVISKATKKPITYDPQHLINSNFAAITADQNPLLETFLVTA